jgi:ABC-type sugar transport system substrate-binding protein
MHVIHQIEESLMKRTSLAVLMIALALVALAAPMAFAQAPAPKVTINGIIDMLTTYAVNTSNYNGGIFNRPDSVWYSRTRGRFDIIGEVGKAKAVLGLEIDTAWGQTGSTDTNQAGTAAGRTC